MSDPATAVCPQCKHRFGLGRRANQHQRAGGRFHEAARFCSPACRQAAYRARRYRNTPSNKEPVTLAEGVQGTALQATVTRALETIETKRDFRPEKTTDHPVSDPRLVRDAKYPEMWRVRMPDGTLSDMVNHTRAADAARVLQERMERDTRAPRR